MRCATLRNVAYDAQEACNVGKLTDPITRSVVAQLKARAESVGITQTELDKATGYPQTDISRLFLGKIAHPDLSMLDAIARALDLRLADVIGGVVPPPSYPPAVARLLAVLLGLSPEAQEQVLRIVLAALPPAVR